MLTRASHRGQATGSSARTVPTAAGTVDPELGQRLPDCGALPNLLSATRVRGPTPNTGVPTVHRGCVPNQWGCAVTPAIRATQTAPTREPLLMSRGGLPVVSGKVFRGRAEVLGLVAASVPFTLREA